MKVSDKDFFLPVETVLAGGKERTRLSLNQPDSLGAPFTLNFETQTIFFRRLGMDNFQKTFVDDLPQETKQCNVSGD